MLHAADPSADRGGALHQGGLARLARDAQLQGDCGAGIGDGEIRRTLHAPVKTTARLMENRLIFGEMVPEAAQAFGNRDRRSITQVSASRAEVEPA